MPPVLLLFACINLIGTREPSYAWKIVEERSAEYLQFETNPWVEIDSSETWLLSGNTLTIQLTLTTWYGEESVANHTIEKDNESIPILSLSGPSTFSSLSSDTSNIHISSTLQFNQKCLDAEKEEERGVEMDFN